MMSHDTDIHGLSHYEGSSLEVGGTAGHGWCECLQAALVRKDEEMEQELCSLRQQHERLKLQFQARKPLQ
jgi:hypothetical protein